MYILEGWPSYDFFCMAPPEWSLYRRVTIKDELQNFLHDAKEAKLEKENCHFDVFVIVSRDKIYVVYALE